MLPSPCTRLYFHHKRHEDCSRRNKKLSLKKEHLVKNTKSKFLSSFLSDFGNCSSTLSLEKYDAILSQQYFKSAFQSNNHNRKNYRNLYIFLTVISCVAWHSANSFFCSTHINCDVSLSSSYKFLAARHFNDTASKHFTKMFNLVKIKLLVLNNIKSRHMYVHYT